MNGTGYIELNSTTFLLNLRNIWLKSKQEFALKDLIKYFKLHNPIGHRSVVNIK